MDNVGVVVEDLYEDMYRLCHIRGPEGILVGIAQELGQHASGVDPMRT